MIAIYDSQKPTLKLLQLEKITLEYLRLYHSLRNLWNEKEIGRKPINLLAWSSKRNKWTFLPSCYKKFLNRITIFSLSINP